MHTGAQISTQGPTLDVIGASSFWNRRKTLKIVSEYDQELPQSQTADNPMVPRGRAAQPSQDTRKTNKAKQPALSFPSR